MHKVSKRMKKDNNIDDDEMDGDGRASEGAGRLSSITNASCEITDDYLIEQFLAINDKCAKCVDVYKKYPSIIENEKTAYAYVEKTLRVQLEKTRAEYDSLSSATYSSSYVVDEKSDMTWKFIEALERTKLQLARGTCQKKA